MTAKKRDFKHKLAHYYTTEYAAVFLEDLDIKGMVEQPRNARNKHEVGWRDLIAVFKHHGRKNGCHVVTVWPENTTIDCASCGCSVYKPLWVREHACPTCGFITDRDWNVVARTRAFWLPARRSLATALNILMRGLTILGVVHSEDTPVETATAVSTDGGLFSNVVDASRVTEAGSSALTEAASAAE